MTRLDIFRFGWSSLCITALVACTSRPTFAIVGGELDGNGHPNVGTFVLTKYDNPNFAIDLPNINGSATLVHPRVALMAGHGVDLVEQEIASGFYQLPDLMFSFAADANDPGTWREIAAFLAHPEYNPKVNNGGGAIPSVDIGAFIFREPVTGIEPATLAVEGLLDSLHKNGMLRSGSDLAPFTVVGYGHQLGDPVGIIPGFSSSTDGLRRVAQSEFMALLNEWLVLDQKFARGNGGTYFGDSGGPVLWVDPDTGEEILVAVTSRGDARGVATGIYYRADIAQTRDFIASVIARVEAGEFDASGLAQAAAIGNVPEPASALMFIAAAAPLFMRRRRGGRKSLLKSAARCARLEARRHLGDSIFENLRSS